MLRVTGKVTLPADPALTVMLAARRLATWDGRPSPAVECAITDTIALAERILAKIYAKWPKRGSA